MASYRKKPVVIEAWQVSADLGTMPTWLSDRLGRDLSCNGGITALDIRTLEGTMRANEGDWIIKGVKGEIYPCKPDIFAATYEPVA